MIHYVSVERILASPKKGFNHPRKKPKIHSALFLVGHGQKKRFFDGILAC